MSVNKILAALPPKEYERLAPDLKLVLLPIGSIIYMPEDRIEYVYFPISCVISVLATLEEGATVEAGVTGNEGMVGLPIVLGVESTPNQAIVQGAGDAYQIPATKLFAEFQRVEKLHDLVLRYVHTMFTQVAQTAACNRLHRVEQRLARWLLAMHDRIGRDEFQMTHDFLARMLGVRRAGVTDAASILREAGLIDYTRGRILILNRRGMEQVTCECYRIVKAEYERYLDL